MLKHVMSLVLYALVCNAWLLIELQGEGRPMYGCVLQASWQLM